MILKKRKFDVVAHIMLSALLAAATAASAQTFTLLHTFTGSDGSYPVGSLIASNATLYGMTSPRVFKMNTSGGSCSNLHSFGGSTGSGPHAALTLSGTNLYGMTVEGGAGVGVVFRMNTNGTGYTNLHSFTGYPNDGAGPPGSLTLDGSTLYGMTQQGGTPPQNLGMVFKMNTDGSSYTNLHSFAGGTGDGATPQGSLALANGWLYGMTSASGAHNMGTVFRVSTDGRSYTNFHSFAGGTNDGATAYGSLTLNGSTLYGMTYYGGTNNYGVVFTLSNLPPAPPPSLTIIYADNHAIVSWPSSVSGWTLQTNDQLAAGVWGNYTGPIISNTMTNSPTKGNMFFRLKQ